MKRVLGMALVALALAPVDAGAAEPYKIGMSVGLTGYAATVDTAWRDGVTVAVETLNAAGGMLGRKIELVIEDNHSEPQTAVTAYRKMISADKVDIFISGCVSAGNFAAAPAVAKAEIPMVLCSVLPNPPDQLKWAFTTLPLAKFEVETRLQYLRDTAKIQKFAVLHDPTPYANLQSKAAEDEAKDYGLTLVDNEQYRQEDSDLSVQISKANAAGAGALLKIGLGGTTLTAANNIKQLGLGMLMLTSLEDIAVFKPVAEVMGDKFFFVASPSQVYDGMAASPLKSAIGEFVTPWRAKYGERDPNWASRGWDAVMLTKAAIEKGKDAAPTKVRDALEQIPGFQGTTGIYDFSAANHYGITHNPFLLGQLIGGKLSIAK